MSVHFHLLVKLWPASCHAAFTLSYAPSLTLCHTSHTRLLCDEKFIWHGLAKTGRKNRVRQYGKEQQICDILRFTGLFVRVSGGAERKLKKRGAIFKWPCKKVEKTLRGRENPYMYAWSHARKKSHWKGLLEPCVLLAYWHLYTR